MPLCGVGAAVSNGVDVGVGNGVSVAALPRVAACTSGFGITRALIQVCRGSQSFNVVNTLRVLGRWMRMLTIPNQSSVPKAFEEFHDDGRMKDSPYRDRVVDVMEELYKFTLLTRCLREFLIDRYSERREAAARATLDPASPMHRIGTAGL